MAVTLTYGTYNFVSSGPTPQVGIETRYERPDSGGAAYAIKTVRVVGYFSEFNSYEDNQAAVEALRTALEQDNQTLAFNPGSGSVINDIAKVVSFTAPPEWGQYLANYEVVFEYTDTISIIHNISLTSTLGGVSLDPPPNFGRQYENHSAVMRCKVTISGYFDAGTIAANQTLINALRDVVDNTGGVALVYDGVSATVRNIILDTPSAWTDDIAPYTVTCEFDTARTGLLSGSVALGGVTLTIPPSFGRKHFNDGHLLRCEVSLSGVIDAGSITANQSALESIRDICGTSSATLVYGGFSQTVRKMRLDAPSEWTEVFLPYTITCEYVSTRVAITGTYSLGSFTFPVVPEMGRSYRNEGEALVCEVTLGGVFAGDGINANQALLESLQAVCDDTKATLTYGAFSQEVRSMRVSASASWAEDELPYTVTCEYKTVRAAVTETASLGAFTFPIVPDMGRRYQNDGHNLVCEVVLSGILRADGINANQTLLATLQAVCDDTKATLTYGSITQEVRKMELDASSDWTEDELPYTITCEYRSNRAAITAACSLGSVSLVPVPTMGRRYAKDGHHEKCEVTLVGKFVGDGINANQVLATALEAVCNTSSATLAYGSFTQTVRNMSLEIPSEWAEDELPYTISCEFVATRSAVVTQTCTLCGHTFSQLPSFGRRLKWNRKSSQSDPTSITVEVTLSGKLSTGGVDTLVGAANSLITACNAGSGTLAYGANFSETVRVVNIDTPTDWVEDYLPFSIVCEYDEPIGGTFTGNIVDFQTTQQISEVYQRTAFHEVPYSDGRITQDLGLSHFTITFSGYFVGVTLADALAAYRAEVATRPANGILMSGSTRTEDEDGKKVDYSATYSYNLAATVVAQTSIR